MRRLTSLVAAVVVVALSVVGTLPRASGDEAGARKYLDQAKKQVADKEQAEKIDTTLRLLDAELAGLDQAKKEPFVKEIAAIRTGMQSAADEAFKNNLARDLDRRFELAQGQLGLRNTGINKELDDLDVVLKAPKTETALGPDKVKEYRAKLTGFRAVNTQKMGEETVAEMKRLVEYTEKQMPEWLKDLKDGSPNSRDGAAQSFERQMTQFTNLAKEVPVGNSAVAELLGKMNGMKQQVDGIYGAAMAAEVTDRLKRDWESYSGDMQGWEDEKAPPKFADMVSNSSNANSRLGAPKTVAVLNQSNQFFKNLATNEQAKPSLGSSPLKEFVAGIKAQQTTALTKLGGFAEQILVEAEGTSLTQDSRNRLETFANDDLRLSLEGHPQLAALVARAKAKVAAYDQAAGGVAKVQEEALAAMTASAAKNWPGMISALELVEEFDPAKAESLKGKLIRIRTGSNRRGYDYGVEGNYDFAVDINGKPVAGRYSDAVKAAIEEYKKATGKDSLPEETPYDVIGRYYGDTTTLQRRVQVEAKVDGAPDITLRGEKKEPVEAPVLKILALHCGPVAAIAPQAEVESAVPVAAGGSASADGGFWSRLIAFLLFFLASLAVLMKADFGPLATAPQLARVRENMHARNQTLVGFLLLFMAAYGLVVGVFIGGLIGNVLLIAAGFYLALSFFEKQSWWKPSISATLAGFAVPIGLACAAVALWRLIMPGVLTFI